MAIEIKDPNLLPLKVSLDGTEYIIFVNPSTKRLERSLIAGFEITSNKVTDFSVIDNNKYPSTKAVDDFLPFITLNNSRFRIIKNPDNPNPLFAKTLESSDIVINGFANNNVLIERAVYNSGDINDFGTDAGNYQDGSYTNVKFFKLS